MDVREKARGAVVDGPGQKVNIKLSKFKDLDEPEQVLGWYTCRTMGSFGVAGCARGVVHSQSRYAISNRGMIAGHSQYFFVMQPASGGLVADVNVERLVFHLASSQFNHLHQLRPRHHNLCTTIVNYIGDLVLSQTVVDRNIHCSDFRETRPNLEPLDRVVNYHCHTVA